MRMAAGAVCGCGGQTPASAVADTSTPRPGAERGAAVARDTQPECPATLPASPGVMPPHLPRNLTAPPFTCVFLC